MYLNFIQKVICCEKRRKDDIILETYNLILDNNIFENESEILINFKNSVGTGNNFENSLKVLERELRQLSLKNLKINKTLSKNVGELYMKISTKNLFKDNLERGIVGIRFLANS